MFETKELHPTRPEDRTITVFLNRACPRTCYQCGIADNSRTSMRVEDWIQGLDNLHRAFGATFFLFLGVEPLLLRQGMVDIVAWLKAKGLDAAWYTTSPEPMFSLWRDKLVEAGVQNWSSGVDTLPHLDPLDPVTEKKARESVAGLQWMAARGVKTHTTTTVHRKNLHMVPEILLWLHQNIPGVELALNFVEWRKEPGFDFFSLPEDMLDMLWLGTPGEEEQIRRIMGQCLEVRERVLGDGGRFHTPVNYMSEAHRFYNTLNLHCQGAIGPSVDADGTMRLCGYHRGWESGGFNVVELIPGKIDPVSGREIVRLFQDHWERDLWGCSGCYWACFRLPDAKLVPHAHPLNVPARSLPTVKGKLR